MKDQICFLTKIKKLKPYIVKFNKNSAIKAKNYLVNYAMRDKKYWPIILIIYNKYTFFSNDRVQKT